MIDLICATSLCAKPRTYRNNARRDYLNWARARKHSVKRTRKAIRQQLQYIQRDLKYIDAFLDEGKTLSEKHQKRLETIRKRLQRKNVERMIYSRTLPGSGEFRDRAGFWKETRKRCSITGTAHHSD